MTPIFKILTPRVLKNKHLHRKYQLQPAASGQVFDKFCRTLHAAGNRRKIVSNKEIFARAFSSLKIMERKQCYEW
ncbi:MAG TPA: hypothetical protein ENK14_12370 [Caldithrix sp.]|nr:hypothetical protein [Caldithrix sp.]